LEPQILVESSFRHEIRGLSDCRMKAVLLCFNCMRFIKGVHESTGANLMLGLPRRSSGQIMTRLAVQTGW